ncbi:glycosyltransferase family 2 protein [Aureimonas populi]|uniref:Glycosyltransferase family 2 protein n=1 Tax=Aureimonas populi TaxID=1701758 RepID=A0ABW5CMR2_9HYPH|nr:glycosyltransferase family A protein [Aureimonas populi]
MPISLIICTRNRGPQLKQALERLPHSDIAAHGAEVVLVDNGSTDTTQEVVRAFQAGAAYPVVLVHEARKGLSNARNAGLRASRGEIILFTDDDCYLAPDYVTKARAAFARREFDFCGGRILLHDPQDYPIAIYDEPLAKRYPARSVVEAGYFQGASLNFRRSVWEAIGDFDAGLGAGTPFRCEDIEWVARALMAGFTGAHEPSLVVHHHHGRQDPHEVRALERDNDLARGAFYMVMMLGGHLSYGRAFAKRLARTVKKPATAGRTFREIGGAAAYLAHQPRRILSRASGKGAQPAMRHGRRS